MTLLAAGVDITVIALWLGHEHVQTTQIYLHGDLATKERGPRPHQPTRHPTRPLQAPRHPPRLPPSPLTIRDRTTDTADPAQATGPGPNAAPDNPSPQIM